MDTRQFMDQILDALYILQNVKNDVSNTVKLKMLQTGWGTFQLTPCIKYVGNHSENGCEMDIVL